MEKQGKQNKVSTENIKDEKVYFALSFVCQAAQCWICLKRAEAKKTGSLLLDVMTRTRFVMMMRMMIYNINIFAWDLERRWMNEWKSKTWDILSILVSWKKRMNLFKCFNNANETKGCCEVGAYLNFTLEYELRNFSNCELRLEHRSS